MEIDWEKIKSLRNKWPGYKSYQYLCGAKGETPLETEEWREHEEKMMRKIGNGYTIL